MSVAVLVVGAGRGERFRRSGAGADPGAAKVFARLRGEPVLVHAVRAVAAAPSITRVVPVVAADALARLEALAPGLSGVAGLAPAVAGGAERQDSVAAGLAALPGDVTLVAVHDAARPLVRPEDVERVVQEAARSGAAILAVPIADTVKRVRGGHVVETPDRAECFAAQTPQVFRVEWLREALAKARAEGLRGTDDAALVERLGVRVAVVPGDPANRKITTLDDLAFAEAWLAGVGGER